MDENTGCRTFSKITKKDSDEMDFLISEGYALNRSDFTRLAIKQYILDCNKNQNKKSSKN